MKNTKKKLMLIDEDDEEDGVEVKDKKRVNASLEDEEEEDDDEDLDEFENDGFIVDDEEEEEGVQIGKDEEKRKKKKKRKLLKNLVLDDDDFALLQENKISGLVQLCSFGNEKFKRLKKGESRTKSATDSGISADDVSLYDGCAEDEEASHGEEDEMADFIVYDEKEYEIDVPWQPNLRGKESKQVTVASSSALEDSGGMFHNTDEILKCQLVKIVKPDDFNELDLDNYITERDAYIKEKDTPERMQMFEEIAGPPLVDEMNKEEESSWILNQLATNMCLLLCKKKPQEENEGTNLCKKINKEDIMRFLELCHVEKYDIPFIAKYRKEKCRSLLEDPEENGIENKHDNEVGRKPRLKWHKILWAVNELDKKWLLLKKRKSALQIFYNKRYEEESCNVDVLGKLASLEQQFDRIMKFLELAETERDVDDVDIKFSLHFPPPEEGITRLFKQPKRRSEYNNCSKACLWKLVQKFGCSSEQFGLHLTLEKVGMDFREDPAESPEAIASDFTCPMFETPAEVLKGARLMAAVEMSCEPCIRKHVRGIFMDKALVSTCPTPEGDKAIDSFHLLYGVKWLLDKPLDKFQEAQWLLIQKAEEEKLLQVTIKLPENILNKLIADSYEIYLVGSGEGSTRLWDEQRKLIIHDVFSNFLLPSLEKETRSWLTTRAKNWLLMEYGKQLWNRVSVAPYKQKEGISSQEEGIAPRVMACCWAPGQPPITFVMLDSSGHLVDVLQTKSLSLRSQNVIDQQRKKYDQQCVLKFIINHRPNVIILGAVNTSCTWLKDDIEEIILQMEECPTGIGQMTDKINIVYGDESFAQLYENSKVSLCQLPGQQGIVRRAVALGRYLQNPLAMIATLCGPQKEIVSWKLNPLDHFLTSDEKYEMVEIVMVDVTNQVGMDVNFAMSCDWLSAPLQFVSGLGPQKSASLQRELIGGKPVNNRCDLAACGLRPKKIFYNAVGFLRVCGSQLFSATRKFGLLDDTRIHPESYGLAERLANAVHNDVAEVQPIIYIKNNLRLLNDFDIDDYAVNYEREQGENKRETLHDIKDELVQGFLDPRKPYENLTNDEVFYLISGKNEDAFAEGRIIQVVVRRVLSQRAFCALDSGLTGVIMKDDYLDGTDDFSLTDRLHEGDILTCKIKQLEKSRYQVLLTCKESELKGCRYQNLHEVDPFHCEGKKNLLRLQDEARKDELAKKHSKQRIINHPSFKNITRDEAVEFLSTMDIGENIFHPSLRGPFYLTLTLKVNNGVFVHKDIIEGEKDLKDITSLLHIGKTLKIGDYIFKNLDEVMDQYVNPMITHLKAIMSFQKFKKGSKAEVDELLRAEKSEYPMRIVYCFGISYEYPGTFILSYIRSSLRHEYIGLYPEGFKFRKQMFGKIEQVVAYFQRHIDDLQHGSALMGNTPCFSSGASMGSGDDGGWQGQLNSSKDRSSTPGSRGRKDYSRDGGGRNEHPSGLPRPNGGRGSGRGRGRGTFVNERSSGGNTSEGFGPGIASKWGSDSKDADANSGCVWGSTDTSAIGGNWFGDNDQSKYQKNESNNDGNWGGCNYGGRKSYRCGDDDANKTTHTAGWSGCGSGTTNGGSWSNSFGGSKDEWDDNNEVGNASDGHSGRSQGRGRGRSGANRGSNDGRGRGRGHGRGYNSYECGDDNTHKETLFGGGWGGSGNDSTIGGNWSNDGARNTGGWNECNEDRSAIGGSWGGNERNGNGRGRGGNRGSHSGGGWGGNRSDNNRGNWNSDGMGKGMSGRGRASEWSGNQGGGSRGRGFSNDETDNKCNGNDFGYNTSNWGTNSKHTGEEGGGMSTFSGGNAGGGNWGSRSSDSWGGINTGGNALGGTGRAGNAGGDHWGRNRIGNDSQGILGSGPTSGNDWLASSSKRKDRNGMSRGDFNNDAENGWGAGSGKSSTHTPGRSGWS